MSMWNVKLAPRAGFMLVFEKTELGFVGSDDTVVLMSWHAK
jgi:hypothetical protein